jgi:hypothetical protein
MPPTDSPMTVSAEATIEAVVSPCGEGERIEPWQWIESLSPNGKWAAFQCYSERLGTYANVIRTDYLQSWQVSYKDTYAKNHEAAEGISALVIPFNWSADERYFYVTIHIDAIDGPGTVLVNGHALYRLDLVTGQVSEILPSVPFLSYAMSISPNSRFLAYVKPGETSTFYVRDFQTGEEKTYSLSEEFDIPAFFVWAEDSKKLVFSVAYENFDIGVYSDGMGLFLLNRESDSLTMLIKDPPQLYVAKQWISETEILISILWDEFSLPDYIFDLETMTLTPYQPLNPTEETPYAYRSLFPLR